jgi:hypothetical protein
MEGGASVYSLAVGDILFDDAEKDKLLLYLITF